MLSQESKILGHDPYGTAISPARVLKITLDMNNILTYQHLKKALLVALWFCFLTFPIMVIKVNPYEETVVWRWQNMLYVGLASFFLYLLSRAFLGWKTGQEEKRKRRITPDRVKKKGQNKGSW
ncbi:MAG: hypothetical protein D3925_07460 [Candidatus Electrothrix sp. AR5]|nr:hypothetical protein [Candidatus Electrothrix sp. AR5]